MTRKAKLESEGGEVSEFDLRIQRSTEVDRQ